MGRSHRTNRTRPVVIGRHAGVAVEQIPADVFLAGFPEGIRATADDLRALVKRAVPGVVERVRPGWRLIGYEVPLGRRSRYFAFVAPESEHVHLGFEYGVWMADPDGLLQGAHPKLRKVRYVTYRPGQTIPRRALVGLTREAARIAAMSRLERLSLSLEPGPASGPGGGLDRR